MGKCKKNRCNLYFLGWGVREPFVLKGLRQKNIGD